VDPHLITLITERRKAIEDDAPCVGCGSTLVSCKANRGKDKTAPAWFGCCARGTAMAPCDHRQSRSALLALMGEIERGEVRSLEDVFLDSIEEFPLFSLTRRGRWLRAQVLARTIDPWPDDVPMEHW